MKEFKVGVFTEQGTRKMKYSAYSLWYNPNWAGCCEHTVYAKNGTDAKKLAIAQHKDLCGREMSKGR